MPAQFIIIFIIGILVSLISKLIKGAMNRSYNEERNNFIVMQKKLKEDEAENLYRESCRERDRLSRAFAEDQLKNTADKLRQEGKSEEDIKKLMNTAVNILRIQINYWDPTREKDRKLHDAWMSYYRNNAKLAWVYADREAKRMKEIYDQEETHYQELKKTHPSDSQQLIQLQHELEQNRLFMEQQMRETQITMDAQREFIKASTGIEFGGYNPDLNLNPAMHQMVDSMNHMPSTPNFDNMPVSSPMQDFNNNNTFGNGF